MPEDNIRSSGASELWAAGVGAENKIWPGGQQVLFTSEPSLLPSWLYVKYLVLVGVFWMEV